MISKLKNNKVFMVLAMMMRKVKSFKTLLTTAGMMMFMQVCAFAEGDLQNSIFATGTKALINDLTKYLIILAPLVGGAAIAYFAIRKAMCDDEMDHKKWDKNIKMTIVAILIAVTAGALIKLITGYYTA